MLTVKEYLDKRNHKTYGKKVRIIDPTSRGGYSDWTQFADRPIFKISITTKFIFIYVK